MLANNYVNVHLNLLSLLHELNSICRLKKISFQGQQCPISPNRDEIINNLRCRARTIIGTLEKASPQLLVSFSFKKKTTVLYKQENHTYTVIASINMCYWLCIKFKVTIALCSPTFT